MKSVNLNPKLSKAERHDIKVWVRNTWWIDELFVASRQSVVRKSLLAEMRKRKFVQDKLSRVWYHPKRYSKNF